MGIVLIMNKTPVWLIVSFVIVFALASLYLRTRSVSPTAVEACTNCNVLIVAFDALQAKHVSHLGYDRATTPTIDSIATEGVTFSNVISAAPWTVPSYMSMFTGLHPTEHRVINKFVTFTPESKVVTNLGNLSPNVRTLAQVFKDNGYVTGGFTGDAGVSSPFGYNQGFDVFMDNEAFGPMSTAADQALAWLKENQGQKFFLFLHGYDMHGQFKLPENYTGQFMPNEYNGKFRGTPQEQRDLRELGLVSDDIGLSPEDVAFWRGWYDSKIRDADTRFASFWDEFQAMGLADNTIVILLSDHGTEFYEHRKFDHGHTLYQELVNTVLVFKAPNLPPSTRIDIPVSTLDIAPTLLGLLGIEGDQTFRSQQRGLNLQPVIAGGTAPDRELFTETDYRNYTHKRGVVTPDGWKYIRTMENGTEELYDLNADPGELTNLAASQPSRTEQLRETVSSHLNVMGANPDGPWEIGCLPVYGDQCL